MGFAAAIVIVILGLATAAFYYRGNAISARADAAQARADLATAVAVNEANEAAMARLKADNERADKLAADLADEIDAANNSTLAVAKTLADLRAKNADVDSYLKQPVPSALRSLYDSAKGAH
ncbi:hypothetical protein [Mesorhizobium sp. M0088]|uniref:hypothetical protein n=1 Tax=Mesorhizobium sp. M0088 TaxID=2956873 RepID=UPI0033368F81